MHRKRSGLSQEDLVFLVTGGRGGRVSKFERRVRGLSLRAVFGFQVLFGAAAHEILPEVYAEVELSVLKRVHLLREELATQRPTAQLRRKLRALAELSARSR